MNRGIPIAEYRQVLSLNLGALWRKLSLATGQLSAIRSLARLVCDSVHLPLGSQLLFL
jgi:hypothetical protein